MCAWRRHPPLRDKALRNKHIKTEPRSRHPMILLHSAGYLFLGPCKCHASVGVCSTQVTSYFKNTPAALQDANP